MSLEKNEKLRANYSKFVTKAVQIGSSSEFLEVREIFRVIDTLFEEKKQLQELTVSPEKLETFLEFVKQKEEALSWDKRNCQSQGKDRLEIGSLSSLVSSIE